MPASSLTTPTTATATSPYEERINGTINNNTDMNALQIYFMTTTAGGKYNDANAGLKGEQAENMLLSQNAIMDDLRNFRDSISGVNIDEELADIIKFQHGYNAAAKYVSVIDQMLDTIINRLGV